MNWACPSASGVYLCGSSSFVFSCGQFSIAQVCDIVCIFLLVYTEIILSSVLTVYIYMVLTIRRGRGVHEKISFKGSLRGNNGKMLGNNTLE